MHFLNAFITFFIAFSVAFVTSVTEEQAPGKLQKYPCSNFSRLFGFYLQMSKQTLQNTLIYTFTYCSFPGVATLPR